MFRKEGAERPDHHNQILAGYLATIAGFVNSAGFLLIGSFTSHVTGNVGRFAEELALGRSAALFAAILVIAYFVGAFVASVALESNLVRSRPFVYGLLMVSEAGLLVAFTLLSYFMDTTSTRIHDSQAALLCMAMGLQNSLVTRLSGAIVRTTHLTGVVTDIGIEAARWFRFWRTRFGQQTHLRMTFGAKEAFQPNRAKALLLLTILGTFIAGSALGAIASLHFQHLALVVPIAMLVAGGGFAIVTGYDLREPVAHPARNTLHHT